MRILDAVQRHKPRISKRLEMLNEGVGSEETAGTGVEGDVGDVMTYLLCESGLRKSADGDAGGTGVRDETGETMDGGLGANP